MAYGVTVHKMQGQTKDLVILDLNRRPAPTLQQITYASLIVSLSRVRKSINLKLMPLHNPNSLDYVFALKPPIYLKEWFAGFDAAGVWSADEARRKIGPTA